MENKKIETLLIEKENLELIIEQNVHNVLIIEFQLLRNIKLNSFSEFMKKFKFNAIDIYWSYGENEYYEIIEIIELFFIENNLKGEFKNFEKYIKK